MRKFNVLVNGENYDVTVDEIAGGAVAAPVAKAEPAPVAPAAAPKAESAPAQVAAPVSAGSVVVNSPMPGTIISISANVGDVVKAGQTLLVLEAMKMENDIVAPQDGKVAAIFVKQGDSVESNSKLVSLE